MSWGEDLWDQYNAVLAHSKKETEDLDGVFAKFVKERGDIEKEYAKKMRRLVDRFNPRERKKDEEPTLTRGFRLLLAEVGFQAGQHEILAEALSKTIYQLVQARVKTQDEAIVKFRKEAKSLKDALVTSERALDKSKQKYRSAYLDWEAANDRYTTADTNGQVSPNEVAKLRAVANSKQHGSDDFKGQYAQQLLKTNQFRERYYYSDLPAILNNMQNEDQSRVTFSKEMLAKCLQEERSIGPIVAKCYEGMDKAIDTIDALSDSNLVIDKLKTGHVPPPDFTFEEMGGGLGVRGDTMRRKSSFDVRKSSFDLSVNGKDNVNYFQKKRELEKKIDALEKDVEKGQKEMKALQLMVQTYTQNPSFGDAKQFQSELDTATHKVQLQQAELHNLKTELQEVEIKLESLKNRSAPSSNTLGRPGKTSPTSSMKSGSVSQGYVTSSNYSGSDKDSIEGSTIPPPPDFPNLNDSWGDEFEDDIDSGPPPPPPPPPPPAVIVKVESVEKCMSLYPFEGDSENSISMAEGEEFIVLEPDQGGWMKVRRVDDRFFKDIGEGYVPSAFVQMT